MMMRQYLKQNLKHNLTRDGMGVGTQIFNNKKPFFRRTLPNGLFKVIFFAEPRKTALKPPKSSDLNSHQRTRKKPQKSAVLSLKEKKVHPYHPCRAAYSLLVTVHWLVSVVIKSFVLYDSHNFANSSKFSDTGILFDPLYTFRLSPNHHSNPTHSTWRI